MIPYGSHSITQEDIDAVVEALRSPRITQGPRIAEFERNLAEHCQVDHAVAVSSGTAALHLACLAVGLGAGDRLWTTPYSFLASANCGLYCGAKVDFVDIDERTGNLDSEALEAKLESLRDDAVRPKVLIPVHFAGAPCDMTRIAQLAGRHGIAIIEDASHALGASLDGAPVGNCAYSSMSTFSFHPVKSITTAEGGAITTNDESLARTLRRLREHGMNRDPETMQGDSHGPWFYEMAELGLNYRINDLQAALGTSQLNRLSGFIAARSRIAQRYRDELEDLPIDFLYCPPTSSSAHHLFVIRLRSEDLRLDRSEVFRALQEAGIGVQVHYIPIHLQPVYQRLGFAKGDFPAAESLYRSVISLPIYPELGLEDQAQVIRSLREILN
ncbi:MAG: UDP-4-amino-4,6-dideoxy-N-acetyl-beta-L-altrosamine transaminase [Planctomycetota bacterium]|jgi:UDP-4-amino-4,6-dideoxy-N-acetyl-beta-L-altrosamine transaminase